MLKNDQVLADKQIHEIKKLVAETRRFFGVHPDVPIGNDIRLLLDKKDILLCEYPFPDMNGTHTYGNITWFKTDNDTITFIGFRLISLTPDVILPSTEIPAHSIRITIPSVLMIMISSSELTAFAPTTLPVFSVIL